MAQYTQLLISVPKSVTETVTNLLMERGASGVEVRDQDTATVASDTHDELVIWTSPETAQKHLDDVEKLMASLEAMHAAKLEWHASQEQVDDSDWHDRYKQFVKTTHIGQRFVIKPSWETYSPRREELMIEVDPGRAFGTGQHASTKLVLATLERCAQLDLAHDRILDLGCGSGILAIAAAKLWPRCNVTAIDCDEMAVETCIENCALNNVSDRIDVSVGDAKDLDGSFDIVLANLQLEILQPLKSQLVSAVKASEGVVIVSGLLAAQSPILCEAYAEDLSLLPYLTEQSDDGWQSVMFKSTVPK